MLATNQYGTYVNNSIKARLAPFVLIPKNTYRLVSGGDIAQTHIQEN